MYFQIKNKYFFYCLWIGAIVPLNAAITYAHLNNNWYPHDAQLLTSLLQKMHKDMQKKYNDSFIKKSCVRACIVPHASMHYSGITACAVYQHIDPSTERIVVIAPDHSGKGSSISVPSTQNYTLPAGSLAIDQQMIKALVSQKIGSYDNDLFEHEHSCEMQLPFIQFYCPRARIVPFIVGNISCDQARTIAQELKKYISKKTVVIVSSDFVHYGNSYNFTPFLDHQQLRARALNSKALQCMQEKSCEKFDHFLMNTKATICGANPLKIMLHLMNENAFGPIESRLVAYNTSSASDADDFVSYIGMIFTSQLQKTLLFSTLLTEQEKAGLLQQAYDTLKHMFDVSFDETLYYPLLSSGVCSQHGVFATLYGPGHTLRGCIGKVESHEPLYKTIAAVTQDAAISDSRFNPLTKKMVDDTVVHLSILSHPKRVATYRDITLGKDGIIFELNNRSALFLPEVAAEQGWTKDQMLNNISQKAGLDIDAWRSDKSVFKTFSTITIP